MPLSLSVVTPERTVLERDDVLRVTAPASEGQVTILPRHAALMTSLGLGELTVVTPDGTAHMAVHGGFLQVADDHVSVLADGAEHVDEIDEARAEAARERAQRRMAAPSDAGEAIDLLRAQASLQRALLRLRVRRRRSGTGVPSQR
ncbi:MAG: ATP synthase F1 subunit epsilon [Chloroflexi bacterium]|nr:ATP synthase F1 subunit epsilon [Chloroflexota bacterium]MQC19439.1 ATP synthase F1 subunit epsilon [Chloroflexota bacterium]